MVDNNHEEFEEISKDQLSLFEMPTEMQNAWNGMPEFHQEDRLGFRQLIVHFKDEKAVSDFFKLVGQSYTDKTKYIWFPEDESETTKYLRWVSESR